MINSTTLRTTLKFLGMTTLLCSLVTPSAMAAPEQDTAQAEKEFARGDLMASMALWRKAAQQGYAPAQVRLADILDKAEEDEEAAGWYRKAADQGNAAGEYGLAQMLLKGEGVKKDVEQARIYTLRAAEQGYLDAMVLMMEAYRTGGLGLTVDSAKSQEWEAKVIALVPGYKRVPVKKKAGEKAGANKAAAK